MVNDGSMDLPTAAENVLLGESMRSVASSYREELLTQMGFDPDEAPSELFHKESTRFMNQLCRYLGDRHAGERRVGAALLDWVRVVEDYDAFDALLVHFDFDGREAVLRRGRMLFPGPLTAHWGERAENW